jgi:hypothetical protein
MLKTDLTSGLCASAVLVLILLFMVGSYKGTLKILSYNQKIKPKQDASQLKDPETPDIKEYISGYQSYQEIVQTIKKWENVAPNLVEVGTYGTPHGKNEHYYLKISNELRPSSKKVLITACIHGNEPWSTSTVMAYAGKLLSSYGKEKQITEMLNSKSVYIIPVVSPESYPNSRNIMGVDPNRNFPTLKDPNRISVAPVKNLQDFFLKIKPDSVLAGHTYGRIFLIPWGDSTKDNPNLSDYERIASKMCDLSGYRYQRACEMYNRPIYGTEIDWYHRNGAFAMVMEFGSHQRKPTLKETEKEFNKTFESVLYFIQESTEVKINN